jgi:hypothetical protein
VQIGEGNGYCQQIDDKRVHQIIEDIETKIFSAPVRMYQLFRSFDRDGDGIHFI